MRRKPESTFQCLGLGVCCMLLLVPTLGCIGRDTGGTGGAAMFSAHSHHYHGVLSVATKVTGSRLPLKPSRTLQGGGSVVGSLGVSGGLIHHSALEPKWFSIFLSCGLWGNPGGSPRAPAQPLLGLVVRTSTPLDHTMVELGTCKSALELGEKRYWCPNVLALSLSFLLSFGLWGDQRSPRASLPGPCWAVWLVRKPPLFAHTFVEASMTRKHCKA